jgi:hypothetical protein
MNSTRLSFSLIGALVASAGCSSSPAAESPGTFPAAPLMSISSASGTLHVDVRSSPTQPPELGNGSWSYTITDAASGQPAADLSINVVRCLPALGHGTSTVPSVSDMGGGVYVIDDVVLFMPGQWDLRTTISSPEDDELVVSVDIP